MGEAAVNVAKACNYSGAGTVEFLLGDNREFYFLEMNTRLQVEHPVTEMITGLDLVKCQIEAAANMPLSFTQEELKMNGHSLELRVCAEDPYQQFLPNIGKVKTYQIPTGPGIRIDDCMESNMEIPIYYDNMLAKLIVWGSNRQEAISRMKRAISEYVVTGIQTTLPFGEFVMNHKAFIDGDFNTHFIQDHFDAERDLTGPDEISDELAVAAATFFEGSEKVSQAKSSKDESNNEWYANRSSLR